MGVFSSPDFEPVGFLICTASVAGQSVSIVMTAYVMGGTSVKLEVWDVLLYAAAPTLLVLIPWSYSLGEFEALNDAVYQAGYQRILILICIGGCLAFSYNVIATIFIRMTSSVYYGATGGFRSALAIVISFSIFPQKITYLSIAGTAIAMLAFIANSYLTLRERLRNTERAEEGTKVEKQHLLDEESGSLTKAKLLR